MYFKSKKQKKNAWLIIYIYGISQNVDWDIGQWQSTSIGVGERKTQLWW